jgi:hypothetical protein
VIRRVYASKALNSKILRVSPQHLVQAEAARVHLQVRGR